MDLDVLLPFHRVDKFLEEAIDSLAASRGVSLRVVLIDDRIDRTADIIQLVSRFKNFEVMETLGGQGYGEALKVGSAALKSDHVALFNSDDLVHPNRLLMQLKALKNSDVSITNLGRIDKSGRSMKSITGKLLSRIYDQDFLIFGSYGANATWCMRKNWWIENSFFDRDECLDWRIGLKRFSQAKIAYTGEILYFYRKHKFQVTKNRHPEFQKMDIVYKSWENYLQKYNIGKVERGTFDLIATPWLSTKSVDIDKVHEFLMLLRHIFSEKPLEVQKQAQILIYRRMLLGIRHQNISIAGKIKLFKGGYPDSLRLLNDVMPSFLQLPYLGLESLDRIQVSS